MQHQDKSRRSHIEFSRGRDELPREAFGVRGACSRFRTAPRLTTAPASWTHSKRFAQFGCGFAAPRLSRLCGLTGLPLIAGLSVVLALLSCTPTFCSEPYSVWSGGNGRGRLVGGGGSSRAVVTSEPQATGLMVRAIIRRRAVGCGQETRADQPSDSSPGGQAAF